MKTFDGREKSLLRAATSDLLPASVLNRKKSPYPSTQDVNYELGLREQVAAIVTDAAAPVLELGLGKGIRELLEKPVGSFGYGGPFSGRAVLERLVDLNAWIKDYDVSVES
jgi:asparagine synthase (glutamine-hydrolysing)